MVNFKKEGPKLERGSYKTVALPKDTYQQLNDVTGPKEAYHEAVQRLINFYRANH